MKSDAVVSTVVGEAAVPTIFEPTPRFDRGVHKTLEVDAERLNAVLKALDVAYQLGEAAPIVSLINAHVDVTIDPEQFFESDDGYPACGNLPHYIPQIVRAEGSMVFGLGVLGEIYDADLLVGNELIDHSRPVSPQWLAADVTLPFRYSSADEMLEVVDFAAGINDEALSAASEAFDMGELGDDISGVGDFQVDALDDWAARLRNGLADFKLALEDVAARDGIVMNWFER
jgi:hypothetical protein